MMARRWEHVLVVLAGAYVLLVGWAMTALSYDIWGAFIVVPVVIAVTLPLLARVFRGEDAVLVPIAIAALVAKLAATLIRYWVAFDAYGGQADAGQYHDSGRVLAEQLRGGDLSVITGLASETGTEFVQRLTGIVYAVFGSSLLGGFMLFAWMGFFGLVLFVRAATIAVPGLLRRRYAALTFFAPSLLFWSSSIGKESFVLLCVGLASYGGSRLLIGQWAFRSLAIAAVGILGAGFVRPHFAAIWVAALALALLVGAITGSTRSGILGRVGTFGLAMAAVLGLTVIAAATLEYLDPPKDDTESAAPVADRVTDIFGETERRTSQGGSSFEVIMISGPQDYPVAILRTLTRPVLGETKSLAELIPAVEMTALLALAAVSWRRIVNLPLMMLRTPYLVR